MAVPLRVDSGIVAAVPRPEALPFLIRTNMDWVRDMRFNWEALTNKWNQWILGYNADRQREMLERARALAGEVLPPVADPV